MCSEEGLCAGERVHSLQACMANQERVASPITVMDWKTNQGSLLRTLKGNAVDKPRGLGGKMAC